MVHETLFDKRSGFPALGARAQNGDQIDPARSYGCVAADVFKALTPEHLTHSRHMLDAHELIVVTQIPFTKGRATHSELRVLSEPIHEERKIVRIKGNIGVEVADDVVLQTAQLLLAGANGDGLPGKIPLPALGHLN